MLDPPHSLHWLFRWLCSQVLAFSATYTEVLLAQLRQLMTFPHEVMLCPETVTLRGAFLPFVPNATCSEPPRSQV